MDEVRTDALGTAAFLVRVSHPVELVFDRARGGRFGGRGMVCTVETRAAAMAGLRSLCPACNTLRYCCARHNYPKMMRRKIFAFSIAAKSSPGFSGRGL